MNDKTRQLITKESIDMWESLRLSVEEAGGGFDKDYYMNMSVADLISLLCTNSVRFIYKPNMQADYDYYKNTIEIQNSTIKELKEEIKKLLIQQSYSVNQHNNFFETIKELQARLDLTNEDYEKLAKAYHKCQTENEASAKVAKSIVDWLYKNCFSEVDDFECLWGIEDLLSQISNMVTDLTNKEKAQKTIDLLYEAQQKNKKLENDIFHLQTSLDHSYSAEEVTEKIDKVLKEFIMYYMAASELNGEYKTKEEYDKKYRQLLKLEEGNWKYNL